VSEFVLQSALAAAAEVLAERQHFELDPGQPACRERPDLRRPRGQSGRRIL
jgi:hypothetical protein